jgi:hypothetical protein
MISFNNYTWIFYIISTTLFLRNTKDYYHLSNIYFKIIHYTIIHCCHEMKICWKYSWKPFCESVFSSDIIFLMMSQKQRFSNADFNPRNRLKSAGDSSGEYEICYSVATEFFFRNTWPITNGLLEHCFEVATDCWFLIFGAFLSDRIPKATKDINVTFFI